MDGFLKLNRHKLLFAFIVTSVTSLTAVLILLTIGYFNGQTPDIDLLPTVHLISGIGFPFLIIAIAYLECFSKQRVRERAFSRPPFNELDKTGFSKSLINEKSKWYFTEETKEEIINDFQIKCNITREKSKTIKFKALTKPWLIEKKEFISLQSIFKRNDIKFDWNGLTKMYDICRPGAHAIQQLKSDLE